MTLQYRIRSKSDDNRWRLRIQICREMLLDRIDMWCRDSDFEFPVTNFVTRLLVLFRTTTDPFRLTAGSLLNQSVGTAVQEYSATWPQRPTGHGAKTVEALTSVIDKALQMWESDGFLQHPVDDVVDQIVNAIMHTQYVVFRHHESTRRDQNHFGL